MGIELCRRGRSILTHTGAINVFNCLSNCRSFAAPRRSLCPPAIINPPPPPPHFRIAQNATHHTARSSRRHGSCSRHSRGRSWIFDIRHSTAISGRTLRAVASVGLPRSPLHGCHCLSQQRHCRVNFPRRKKRHPPATFLFSQPLVLPEAFSNPPSIGIASASGFFFFKASRAGPSSAY